MTQPQPPQVKKSNPWKILSIVLLMGIIGMGAVIGILWMGQTKQSEYTRVTVLKGSSTSLKLLGYDYYFFYKQTITGYDPQKPIEIDVQGIEKTLPATHGQTYDILGIEVVVSEVHDDYIILLVKSL